MQNKESWIPSKYVFRNGHLVASRNPREVMISSRLSVDLIAACYEKNIPANVRGRLLDLGCGKVPLYAAYNKYITDNVCVDWENSLHKNPYLDFHADLNEPLTIPAGEFDTIILSDVLEHIRRPEQLLYETCRVLRPGGKLLMSVPFYYWLHEQPFDFFRYTKFALESMAESAGFSNTRVEAYGGAPEVIADIFAKTVLPFRLAGKPLANFAQWFTKMFISCRAGKMISLKSSEKIPFGYFMIAEKA